MAAQETNIVNQCLIRASKLKCTLAKNVRGMFKTISKNPHVVKAGWMIPGSSDLVGHHTMTITQEMVGKQIAVAMYIEAKTPSGVVAPIQQKFIDNMIKAGAIAGVARSPEQMEIILQNYLDVLTKV